MSSFNTSFASRFELATAQPWRLVGAALGTILLLLSVALAAPVDTFERSRTYDTMASLGTENQWALFLGAVGAAMLCSVLMRRISTLSLASLFAAMAYGTFGACILHAGGVGAAGAGTYIVLSLLSLVCGMRMAFDRASGLAWLSAAK